MKNSTQKLDLDNMEQLLSSLENQSKEEQEQYKKDFIRHIDSLLDNPNSGYNKETLLSAKEDIKNGLL